MVVFYRGLHCPICAGYLGDLDRKRDDFRGLGVEPVMVSSDGQERATETKEKWGIENLTVGYGLSIDKAREWGLFVSTGNGKTSAGVEEPAQFNEPGLFLVRPDGTLYASSVNTMPFARPNFGELLKALDFIVAKDYPARGEA
jgi:peroxiredoxin